jgi:molybdopterin-guanine dinucleotide biosynthesis protein A
VIAAIVLAGGRSTRMGEPKALLSFAGKPLLLHVTDALAAACKPLVVVAPADAPLPPLGAEIVRLHDPPSREGPLHALHLALTAVATKTAFLTGCDTPWVTAGLVARLAGCRGEAEAAVVVDGDERENWLVSLVDVTAARAAAAASLAAGERSLRALFARLRVETLLDPQAARDLDTKEDVSSYGAR